MPRLWRDAPSSRRRCRFWGWCDTWPRWSVVSFRKVMADRTHPGCSAPTPTLTGISTALFPTPKWLRRRGAHGGQRVDFAERFVAESPSLDVTGDDPEGALGPGTTSTSLREVLVGMIHEYARHLGHADLLRERIDGHIGQ